MIKKALSVITLSAISIATTFAAVDITQELDNKWGTLKVDNDITLNYEEGTFSETVIFNARLVSQLEGWIDSSKYDDKWSKVMYYSFKNSIGLATVPNKELSLGYNNLMNYDNPVLLSYKNNKLVVINWIDNAWTYIFKLSWTIDWSYKIVDDLSWESSSVSSLLDDDLDLLWTSVEEEDIELNSAWDEPVEVLLSDKATKGSQDMYIIILILSLIVISFIGIKWYKNS